MSDKLLGLCADHSDSLDLLCLDSPCHRRDVLWETAVEFAFERFDDLRSAHFPPLLFCGHALAFICLEQLWDDRERICLALVIIGCIRAALVRVETATDRLDAELLEHVLMVLIGSEHDRVLCESGCTEQAHYAGKE